MDVLSYIIERNRILRHILFWSAWVLGFTFIKSFGEPMNVYLAYLVYYILTLPVFMTHTYLVVYWAGRRFIRGWKIVLFIVIFLLLLLIFSFLDQIISDEILSVWFPFLFLPGESYLDFSNLVISGVGNLYVLLVFVAARQVREWFLSQQQKQKLMEESLFLDRADVNAAIQPDMLLFSMEKIEEVTLSGKNDVPAVIAMLSELLNAVMQAKKQVYHRVDEEVRNVKKLLELYARLMGQEMPRICIEGPDLNIYQMPTFIIFLPLEIICRRSGRIPEGTINITVDREKSIYIYWAGQNDMAKLPDPEFILKEMDKSFPGRFIIGRATVNNQPALKLSESKSEIIVSVFSPAK